MPRNGGPLFGGASTGVYPLITIDIVTPGTSRLAATESSAAPSCWWRAHPYPASRSTATATTATVIHKPLRLVRVVWSATAASFIKLLILAVQHDVKLAA